MPPRLYLFSGRSVAHRMRASTSKTSVVASVQQRFLADGAKDTSAVEQPRGPNQDQLPHVSEEAAALGEVMGETTPEIEEQGTPVQEVIERDAEAQKNAPEVMKKDSNPSGPRHNPNTPGSRAYSTSARRNGSALEIAQDSETQMPVGLEYPSGGLGHKFGLPEMPLPQTEHLKRRYDPVVDQLTKSLMRHGKLSAAQKNTSIILDLLRSTPPPQTNPARPLLGSFPPPPVLPLSPIQYLTATIDSVAPLIKIRQQRGMLGGGASLPVPVPLGVKQRRRTAMQWILGSADKRQEARLADRVAREIINVAEGRSSVWERRATIHKMAVSARSNVRLAAMGPRRR